MEGLAGRWQTASLRYRVLTILTKTKDGKVQHGVGHHADAEREPNCQHDAASPGWEVGTRPAVGTEAQQQL